MKKNMHRLLVRPLFQLVCLGIVIAGLGSSLLVMANLERIQAHQHARSIPASEAAAIVKSGQARAIEVQGDHAF